MPENKNPPENRHPHNPEDEEEKISRVGEEIECQHPECKQTALSLSSYCWGHIEDQQQYQIELEVWAKSGKSMKRFLIDGADLSNLILMGADLSISSLQDSILSGTNLYQANLSEAWLSGADLSNARLNWAKLNGAIGLTRENFSNKLTEEEIKNADKFKGSYLTVKNYFIQNGLYDDASWAAFRERTLERIAWYKQTKLKGTKDLFSWNRWKAAFNWSRSMLMNLLCGYGEKPWKAVVSSMVIIVGFFLFYLFKECIEANPPNGIHWWDYLYFSIVTFTTLGYGDIRPMPAPWARMVASGEAFIGAFMIALFVWTLARRYVAR